MKITYRGDYALKAVLDLALHYDKDVVTISELAERTQAPIKFLEQVLLDLKRGGFLESRRGKHGGYRLAKSPKEITVGDIVRFIDGPTEPINCLEQGYSGCTDIYKCLFRKIWCDVSAATSKIVDAVTFDELAFQARVKEQVLTYSI